MPQMSPMSWITIFFLLMTTFILTMVSMKQTQSSEKKLSQLKSKELNMKW